MPQSINDGYDLAMPGVIGPDNLANAKNPTHNESFQFFVCVSFFVCLVFFHRGN